ncbi:MAG: PIN domain-containing protein [Thermoplasmata archaeon]|nr:MAG: PIN domain-containing protein [Thermoplasmata archaeon]
MFLDTGVIIEIFRAKKSSKRFEKIFELIKNEQLFISVIQLGEISDWCLSNDINVQDRITKLKNIVNIIPINEQICIEGSQIKHTMRSSGVKKFSLMDGIIIASARYMNQTLLTTDNDFRRAKDTLILKLFFYFFLILNTTKPQYYQNPRNTTKSQNPKLNPNPQIQGYLVRGVGLCSICSIWISLVVIVVFEVFEFTKQFPIKACSNNLK